MESLADTWTSFDTLPALPSTCEDSIVYAPQDQQHISDYQDAGEAEWSSWLSVAAQRDQHLRSEPDLTTVAPLLPAASEASTVPTGVPFSATSINTSNTITPPDSGTQLGLSWPTTGPPVMPHPHAVVPANHDQTLYYDHPHLPQQHLDFNHGLAGLYIPNHLPPATHHTVLADRMFRPSSSPEQVAHAKHDSSNGWGHHQKRNHQIGFVDDSSGNYDDEDDDPTDPCYAQLLYKCLKDAPGHELSLKEIYEWVAQYSSKAKDPKQRGWQNSVRHNLSMNAAFVRVQPGAGQSAKKGSQWRLTDEAFEKGVISTTRYRKETKKKSDRKHQPSIKRQCSGQRGGQATRAATRRNQELRRNRSSPYPSGVDRFRQHQHRHNHGSPSPQLTYSAVHSPQQPMACNPATNSPYLFFGPTDESMLPQYTSNPLRMSPLTLNENPARYGSQPKPELSDYEIQHSDFNDFTLFGRQDTPPPDAQIWDCQSLSGYGTDEGNQHLQPQSANQEMVSF